MSWARAAAVAGALTVLVVGALPVVLDAEPAPARLRPVPVYAVSVPDATAGGAGGGVPPANPMGGEPPVDSYTADVYERPFAPGAGAASVLPALDIVSSRAGAGATHLHYRIDLAAVDQRSGQLSYSYSFEVDLDDDPAGDVLVRVDDPGAMPGGAFGTRGVSALWNENSNATGPTPALPDGPGATPDGYEVVVFEGGANLRPEAGGGDTAVLARVAPDRPASVELAVDAAFAQELNAGLPVTKVSFRAGASKVPVDRGSYYLHDKLGRAEAGSPYPFLQRPGAPPSCPATDAGLSTEQRSALDSGTGAETGMRNPCHPSGGVSGYDNTAFVTMAAADRSVPGQAGPDLSVSASHRGQVKPGEPASFTVLVRNGGGGRTTGPVTLDVVLPPGLRHLSSTGRGWACSVSGQAVRCRRPAPLAPGASATPVVVRAATGPGVAAGVALAVRVSGAGDTDPANDTTADAIGGPQPGRRATRSPEVLLALTAVFLGSLVLRHRLKRAETASRT